MGDIRLGVLPSSRKWRQVVDELSDGADVAEIAGASAEAAESALATASRDPALADALWLLTQIPLAARGPDYAEELGALGLGREAPPSLPDLTGAIATTLDERACASGTRSDLGEMAGLALVESLAATVGPELPGLFEPTPVELRTALGRLAGGDRFARLARDFFARQTHRCLDYYLSRELANHVGPGNRFADDGDRARFDAALAQHCREASRIAESFAGGWYGKTVYRGEGMTPDKVEAFARVAFRKLRAELGRRRDAD